MIDYDSNARAEANLAIGRFEVSLFFQIRDIKDMHILAYIRCVHCATGCKFLSLRLHLRTLDKILCHRKWGGTLQQLFDYTYKCENSKLAGEGIAIKRNRHGKIVKVSATQRKGPTPVNASRPVLRMSRKRVRSLRHAFLPLTPREGVSRCLSSKHSEHYTEAVSSHRTLIVSSASSVAKVCLCKENTPMP